MLKITKILDLKKKKRSRILLISNTHKHDLSTFKPKEMDIQWVELLHIDALSSVKKGPLGEKRSTFSQCHPYFNILATALYIYLFEWHVFNMEGSS